MTSLLSLALKSALESKEIRQKLQPSGECSPEQRMILTDILPKIGFNLETYNYDFNLAYKSYFSGDPIRNFKESVDMKFLILNWLETAEIPDDLNHPGIRAKDYAIKRFLMEAEEKAKKRRKLI